MDTNNHKKHPNINNESSNHPVEDDDDDFFTLLDRMRGISDEQLKRKFAKDNNIDYDQEVTKALQKLPEDEQKLYEGTEIIHFDRTEPVETQVQKAIEMRKQAAEKQKKVHHFILGLMIFGISLCVIGIIAGTYLNSQKTTTASTKKTNAYEVDSTEEPVKINEINFPDEVFRTYIKENADKNGDSSLSPDERNSFLVITLKGDPQLTSVKGIQYFPMLQAVNLSNTGLTEIDLSTNRLLENINVSSTKITSLDLSKNVSVTKVNVSGSSITSLILPIPSAVIDLNSSSTEITCNKDSDNVYNACEVKASN